MRTPRVGLTGRVVDGKPSVQADYLRAVERAGGQPVLLPYGAEIGSLDGLLLTGGADLDPALWGEPVHPRANVLPKEREASDLALAKAAIAADLPVLGICLGCQEITVALGGSLNQHVDGHSAGVFHEIEMTGASRARDLVGARPRVNSYHHQAVRQPGAGLRITARSADGVVEGIEHESRRWVVGVQWHPERIAEQAEQLALFRAFVDACRR